MNTKKAIDYLLWALIIGAVVVAGVSGYRYFTQPTNMVISWDTENEIDILGYFIYRADFAEPTGCPTELVSYDRLNDVPIPAEDSLAVNQHQYIDEGIERDKTYCYQLETLERNGTVRLAEDPIILP